MQIVPFGITIRTAAPSADSVARVGEGLRAQGFGVLTEIDVQATLRDNLGVDMEPYLILGACNPSLAHQALNTGRRIGLLLPRNVVVRTEASRTVIEALDPQTMAAVAGEPSLQPVADEAATSLRAAVDVLREADWTAPPGAGSPSPTCRTRTKDPARHDHRTC
jgi:uncharacterized protein (DUF302 family)